MVGGWVDADVEDCAAGVDWWRGARLERPTKYPCLGFLGDLGALAVQSLILGFPCIPAVQLCLLEVLRVPAGVERRGQAFTL